MRASANARAARVVSVGRDSALIVFEDETVARPASIRKRVPRIALAPGDLVVASDLGEGRAVVDERAERSFALVRRTAGGRMKTMAANVESLGLVASFARPPISLPMIDEVLAFAELHDIRPLVIFTKPDLEEPERRTATAAMYAGLGYEVYLANPKSGEGMLEVTDALAHRRTLLIGQSGVGKSSLFRALGGGGAIVGETSRSGRGRQTTTSARLHRFGDGFVIDSPGVGEFALQPSGPRPGHEWFAEVASGFVEFRPRVAECRFTDCTHRVEPNCAIRSAVEAATIARTRYESYLFIVTREVRNPTT